MAELRQLWQKRGTSVSDCSKIQSTHSYFLVHFFSKMWKIFKKYSKMYATVCQFCVFEGKSVENGIKKPHIIHSTSQKRVKRGKSKRLKLLVYKESNDFPHFHTFQNVFEHTSVQKYFGSLFVEKELKSIILRTIQQKQLPHF